jgi:transcriptional regulator with XRE-family HTH domain
MRLWVGISAAQLRAARGLLGWSQEDLARESTIGRATIADFESGKRQPYETTLATLRAALEAAGVEFTNGGQHGVRMTEEFALTGKNARLRGRVEKAYAEASQSNKSRVEQIIAELPGKAGYSDLEWLRILHENLKKRADALGLELKD